MYRNIFCIPIKDRCVVWAMFWEKLKDEQSVTFKSCEFDCLMVVTMKFTVFPWSEAVNPGIWIKYGEKVAASLIRLLLDEDSTFVRSLGSSLPEDCKAYCLHSFWALCPFLIHCWPREGSVCLQKSKPCHLPLAWLIQMLVFSFWIEGTVSHLQKLLWGFLMHLFPFF